MLKNKNLNIILAFVIAIALWAYVLGDVNPITKITVSDVPITYTNLDTLEYSDRIILEQSHDSIDITVSGPRTEVTKVKKSDFSVVADVEALNLGSNVVRLSVKGPDKVEITDVSADKITVIVDQLVMEEKNIEVSFSETDDDTLEPFVVELSRNNIKVSGAKALVEKVDKVNAVIDSETVENSMKTLAAELVAVDANGNVVEGVLLDTHSVNVTVVMHHKKTVTLNVPVENMDNGEYERTIRVPKTIVIKGEDGILSKVEAIDCEPIDLAQYTENTKVELAPIVPNGIQVGADSENIYAEITVKELSKAVVKVSPEHIKLTNADDKLDYDVNVENMTIEVRGKEADLVDLDISAFAITANVKDLEEGTHTVKVVIECQKKVHTMTASTDEIKVTIK